MKCNDFWKNANKKKIYSNFQFGKKKMKKIRPGQDSNPCPPTLVYHHQAIVPPWIMVINKVKFCYFNTDMQKKLTSEWRSEWASKYAIVSDNPFITLRVSQIKKGSKNYEHSKQVQHDKKKFISPSSHVLFCLLYKFINDTNNKVLMCNFPKIFRRFPKFSEHCPKVAYFKCFRSFPKISKDCCRCLKISQDDPKMFRLQTNSFNSSFKNE